MKHISAIIRELKIPEGVLRVTVSVAITDSSNKFVISRFDNNLGQFYNITPNPKLGIKIRFNDIPWDPSHQITINQNNFEEFRSSLVYFYKSLMASDNIYIYNDEGRLVSVAIDTIDIFHFITLSSSIKIQPDVVTDRGVDIPGIRLTLNRPDVTILMSITEFESVYKEIENMSLFDRGMMVLNAFLAFSKINPEMMMDAIHGNVPPKTFDSTKTKKKVVKSPPVRVKPKSLFDL